MHSVDRRDRTIAVTMGKGYETKLSCSINGMYAKSVNLAISYCCLSTNGTNNNNTHKFQ